NNRYRGGPGRGRRGDSTKPPPCLHVTSIQRGGVSCEPPALGGAEPIPVMRHPSRLLVVVLAAAAFVAGLAPLPAARSAPLPVKVVTVPLSGFHAAAATPIPFTMVGVSWAGATSPAVRVRWSEDGSSWSDWTAIEGAPDDAPDVGSDEDHGR